MIIFRNSKFVKEDNYYQKNTCYITSFYENVFWYFVKMCILQH